VAESAIAFVALRCKEGRRDFRFVADRAVSDALLLRRLVKVKEK
jgi:hypothetical protein